MFHQVLMHEYVDTFFISGLLMVVDILCMNKMFFIFYSQLTNKLHKPSIGFKHKPTNDFWDT